MSPPVAPSGMENRMGAMLHEIPQPKKKKKPKPSGEEPTRGVVPGWIPLPDSLMLARSPLPGRERTPRVGCPSDRYGDLPAETAVRLAPNPQSRRRRQRRPPELPTEAQLLPWS